MQSIKAHKQASGVIYYQYIFFHMLGSDLLDGDVSEYQALNASLCSFFHSGVLDRTQTINQGFKTAVLNPLPDLSPGSRPDLSFGEVCDQRAADIITMAREQNRPIYTFWSGGIDSTTALVALLKNLDQTDRNQYLKVYLNDESIKEYPWFYTEVIKPELNFGDIDESFDFLQGNPIIVTGELGDQMFGSVTMIDLMNMQTEGEQIGILMQPYKKILPDLIQYRLKTNSRTIANKVFEFMQPLIERCPWQIKTMFDCLWWLNFTLKWQHVDLRFAAGFHHNLTELQRNYELCCHFFKSDAFQHWSVNNPDMKIKDSWGSYKFPAKEYIYEYTKDKEYLESKNKVPSLSMREIQQSYHCFLLDDFTMIKSHDTQDIGHFRNKYGDQYDWVFQQEVYS